MLLITPQHTSWVSNTQAVGLHRMLRENLALQHFFSTVENPRGRLQVRNSLDLLNSLPGKSFQLSHI